MAKVVYSFSHTDSIAFLLERNIFGDVGYYFGLLHVDFDGFPFRRKPSWIIDQHFCYSKALHKSENNRSGIK
jgi:hypothetical protein